MILVPIFVNESPVDTLICFIRTLLSPWVLPIDIEPTEPDDWLENGLRQLQNSLWPRLESSHRLTIDLIILFTLNRLEHSKSFDFRLGEFREYKGNIGKMLKICR